MKLRDHLAFLEFFARITRRSRRLARHQEWSFLRLLTAEERETLQNIEATWGVIDRVSHHLQQIIPPERQNQIEYREDLTGEELDLLGRLVQANETLEALENSFWSPLKYEFRSYTQLHLDRAQGVLLGRGERPAPAPIEGVGEWVPGEAERLKRLLGVESDAE